MSKKRILMVGACGMGVGPLAIFHAEMGHEVIGYDDYPSGIILNRLKHAGIRFLNHLHGKHEFDEIVVSRAIGYSPERIQRLKDRFPNADVYFRGEYLAKLSQNFETIAIAGSHGKTTTTAHLIAALRENNEPCSYVLGGFFENNTILPAHFSNDSKRLVIEVDESDGTIELFRPYVTVITNVELDHMDFYASEKAFKGAFHHLIAHTQTHVFLGWQVAQQLKLKTTQLKSMHRMPEPGTASDFLAENHELARTVAAWMCRKALPFKDFKAPTVERRQELVQCGDGKWVLSDYAHHPGEIDALHTWVTRRFPDAEIRWVFQPHRYSRTVALKREFVASLKALDAVLIPEYGAFEKLNPEGTSESLQQALLESGSNVSYANTPVELENILQSRDIGTSGTRVYVFAGAGDITVWKDWFVYGLRHPDHSGSYHRLMRLWAGFHEQELNGEGSIFAVNEPLKRKTTLNVGGGARFYSEPGSLEGLQLVLKTSKMLKIPIYLIGKGSNLLVSDEGVDGVVIRLNQERWNTCEYLDDGMFWVGSGLSSKRMCRHALEHRVEGFNFLDGIPGTIGGAICMNAGAMGTEISDRVKEVVGLDFEGKRVRLSREEMGFGYRQCREARSMIVLFALLQGKVGHDRAKLESELEVYRQRRQASQPSEPSAGCMFKNPVGNSAGRLIDQAGLKGFQVGGASVSVKHGNFLVTSKYTSSCDVKAVMDHVQSTVYEKFGVKLHPEIKRFPETNPTTAEQ